MTHLSAYYGKFTMYPAQFQIPGRGRQRVQIALEIAALKRMGHLLCVKHVTAFAAFLFRTAAAGRSGQASK